VRRGRNEYTVWEVEKKLWGSFKKKHF